MTNNHSYNDLDLTDLDSDVGKGPIRTFSYKNPFFVPFGGGKFKSTSFDNLKSENSHFYIFTLKSTVPSGVISTIINVFHDSDSNIEELASFNNYVTLLRSPIELAESFSVKTGLISVMPEHLRPFTTIPASSRHYLVYLMLDSRENQVNLWINAHRIESLEPFISIKLFSSFNEIRDSYLNAEIEKMISNFSDFNWWCKSDNCNISLNQEFKRRKFGLEHVLNNIDPNNQALIEKTLQKTIHSIQIKQCSANNNYNAFVIPTTPAENNSMQTNVNNKFQPMTRNLTTLAISRDEVRSLILSRMLNERELCRLVCGLLTSNIYAHYILKDVEILEYITPLMQKAKELFGYALQYAWIAFFWDEFHLKSKIKTQNRIVLSLEAASLLPCYPIIADQPHINPYFALLIENADKSLIHNIASVKPIVVTNEQCNIVNLEEFKRRLNIFLSGSANIDLLANVDWSKIAVTGGCMAAIMPVNNPLMLKFKQPGNNLVTDALLRQFFDEYYHKSDIDIACNTKSFLEFIDTVVAVKTAIQQQIVAHKLGVEDAVSVKTYKNLAIHVNSRQLREACARGVVPLSVGDYQMIMDNQNSDYVKLYFYELYQTHKREINCRHRVILGDNAKQHSEYLEILNYPPLSSVNLIIYEDCFKYMTDISESSDELDLMFYLDVEGRRLSHHEAVIKSAGQLFMRFSENPKYRISCTHMCHDIEMFRIINEDFMECVQRFHLPCVRSYYDGTTCYLLPSAITAYQTFINMDFKYFQGSNDPIKILNKYRGRGYSTILNSTEIVQFVQYVISQDQYRRMYGITECNEDNINRLIAPLDISDPFFEPRKTTPEFFGLANSSNAKYQNIKVEYSMSCPNVTGIHALFRCSAINAKGTVESVKKWMFDAGMDFVKI